MASIASSTGTAGLYGDAQQNGTALAVDELGTNRIDLRAYDDLSTAKGGSDAMASALAAGAAVVLGPTLSPVASAADPAAQAAGVPVLGVTNATLDLVSIGDMVWRVSLSESAMVGASVKYVATAKSVRSAVLIWEPADGYSTGSAAAFRAAAAADGIVITAEQVYVDGASVADVTNAALTGSPDAVFMALRSAVAADFLVASSSSGAVRVGGNGFNSAAVVSAAGVGAEGLIVSGSWNIGSSDPRSTAFVKSYTARYGSAPDAFAAQGYAAIQVLLAAMTEARTTTPSEMQAALGRLGQVPTVLGSFGYDSDHEPTYPAAVQVINGGIFTLVP